MKWSRGEKSKAVSASSACRKTYAFLAIICIPRRGCDLSSGCVLDEIKSVNHTQLKLLPFLALIYNRLHWKRATIGSALEAITRRGKWGAGWFTLYKNYLLVYLDVGWQFYDQWFIFLFASRFSSDNHIPVTCHMFSDKLVIFPRWDSVVHGVLRMYIRLLLKKKFHMRGN